MSWPRQTLVIELPPDTSLSSDIALCGKAVREAMRELVKDRPHFIGMCRLVSFKPTYVTYEIWAQRYETWLGKKYGRLNGDDLKSVA